MDHNQQPPATGAEEDDAVVERFQPTSGRISGVLGLIAAVVIVALALLTRDRGTPLGVAIAACFGAVVVWAALLRPGLAVTRHDLVMRNMLHTDRIPLAAIDRVAVGQVVAVIVGGQRYICPAIGHTTRETIKARRATKAPTALESYPVFVEARIAHLAEESRQRARIRKGSPEQRELARRARRTFAWPEITALAVTAVGFLVWLVA